MGAFAKVHESHHVAALAEVVVFIRDPYFHAGNLHTGGDDGQARSEAVVIVAEEVAEEEVTVLVVVIGRDAE